MSARRFSGRRSTLLQSAAALTILAGVSLFSSGHDLVQAAGTNAGAVSVKDGASNALTSGGSATQFALTPPVGAACSGDSATGGYKVQSFMVSSTMDLSTLTFNSSGPIAPNGSTFVSPLYANQSAFINKNTAVTTGVLTNLPLFDFSVFSPGQVPAGTYTLGYACWHNDTNNPPATLDKYWSVQISIATSQSDPAGITWSTTVTPSTTTTAATTTTTSATTTTSGSTTTSATGSTIVDTTTGMGDTTTTDAGSLGNTGSNSRGAIIGALALLILGRFSILIARRIRVLPPRS